MRRSPSTRPPPFEWSAFALTVMWISLSYSGFNAAVYVAGEAVDAKRNVPRALLIGTLGVTLIYLALNAIFVYGAPAGVIAGREDVAARAFHRHRRRRARRRSPRCDRPGAGDLGLLDDHGRPARLRAHGRGWRPAARVPPARRQPRRARSLCRWRWR